MESPPSLSCYISQTSKKRVFPASSSACVEAEVIEIPPPMTSRSCKSTFLKQKEVIWPEIIDVDLDEDCADVVVAEKDVDKNGKGKEVLTKFPLGSSCGMNHKSGNGVQFSEKYYVAGSPNLIDDVGADLFYGENDMLYEENAFMDLHYDDYLKFDEQYAFVQSHLDSLDIPPGVEVSVPWFTGHQEYNTKSAVAHTSNGSTCPIEIVDVGFPDSDSSLKNWPLDLRKQHSPLDNWPLDLGKQPNKSTSGNSSSVGGKSKEVRPPKRWEPSSSRLIEDFAQVRKKASASKIGKDALKTSSMTELLKPSYQSAETFDTSKELPWVTHSMSDGESPGKFSNHVSRTPKRFGSGSSTDMPIHLRSKTIPLAGAEKNKVGLMDTSKIKVGYYVPNPHSSGSVDPSGTTIPYFPSFVPMAAKTLTGSFSGEVNYGDPVEVLKKFELFKRFDTVEDSSDHHYSKKGSAMKQPSKTWAKKIQEEWRILENDLPDTIFVRVYESRMDLLRAVIIGAEGTPYHDGLFFFDVFFPSNYPNVPPHVYYHSGGHRINPNLYNCGKVCLSLLNTWSGSHQEKWFPGMSTILQVLVSIQGLVLNAKPFFNEPGYASMSGSPGGEKSSVQYNENTFILSLKTMVCSIRRPPKYFEDFVAGHFLRRARDILVACKAYVDGAQVGCLVKGGVQDVDAGDQSCSQHFRDNLAGYIKTLVDAFREIGVKDCDELLSLAEKASGARTSKVSSSAFQASPNSNFYYDFMPL